MNTTPSTTCTWNPPSAGWGGHGAAEDRGERAPPDRRQPVGAAIKTLRLPKAAAEWLQDKLAVLLKRGAKLGVAATLSVVVGEPILVWHRSDNWRGLNCEECKEIKARLAALSDEERTGVSPGCHTCYESFVDREVTVEGTLPVLSGWRLVALLNWVGDEVTVRTAPGESCPASYYTPGHKPHCDHCDVQRHRVTCYVLRNEEGEYKQAGKQCLADFVRNPDAAAVAEFLASMYRLGEEAEGQGGGARPSQSLFQWLTAVCAVTRCEGRFVSGAQAREAEERGRPIASTSSMAGALLHDPGFSRRYPDIKITAADHEEAARVIAWAKERFPAGQGSEFENNLGVIARSPIVPNKMSGTAAFMPEAFRRELGAKQEEARRATLPPSKCLDAKPGDRVEVEVTVTKVISFDSAYGTTFITIMRADDGSVLSWKSRDTLSVRDPWHSREDDERGKGCWVGVMEGARVRIKATVKEHGEYKGRPQTTVSRVERVCDGWGYAAPVGSPEAELSSRMIAAGRNAPAPKKGRARKVKEAQPSAA